MQSELFATLPPTKLFFKCAVPAVVTSVFGTVAFPIFFLFVLTGIFGLNGVWLMPTVAGLVSGILTLGLVKTLKLKAPGTVSPKTSP